MSNQNTSIAGNNARHASSPIAKALAGLAALAVAMGIGRFAFTPVMPMMLQDTGLTIQGGAWLASANYFGYLVGALSAMALNVRPERAIRGGLMTIGIATMAMGMPLPFITWLVLRLLAGVASAWVLISVSAWSLETLAAYQRPFLNGLVFAGVGSGIAAAGLLCIVLTEFNMGSTSAWTALGLMTMVFTVLIWRYFPAQTSSPGSKKTSADGKFQWNAEAIRLVCCYGVFGFGYIIPATFLPVMAKNVLHNSAAFGWSWPVFGLAAAASTLCVAPLVRLMSRRRLWMLGQWVMALGVVLPIASPQLPAIFAAALCVGGTFMVITLMALQEARHIAGRHATALMAAMTAAFACGQIIGPLTVNAATGGNAGFSSGLIMAAVLLAAGTLLLRGAASDS